MFVLVGLPHTNTVLDLAVGAILDDDGGSDRGAVYILFLTTSGTVSSYQKISDTVGAFTGILDDGDRFGFSLAPMGDLNGDGGVRSSPQPCGRTHARACLTDDFRPCWFATYERSARPGGWSYSRW